MDAGISAEWSLVVINLLFAVLWYWLWLETRTIYSAFLSTIGAVTGVFLAILLLIVK